MSEARALIALVVLLRLAELAYAARNTRALKHRGAVEHGGEHYYLFVLLHASWLLAMLLAVPREAEPSPLFLALFALLQLARLWVILSLGGFWTTRILTLPGVPLVRRGPYRLLRHPNYAVVAAEIAVLPLVFGAWRIALVFSVLNAALLAWRIRVEERALAPRRTLA